MAVRVRLRLNRADPRSGRSSEISTLTSTGGTLAATVTATATGSGEPLLLGHGLGGGVAVQFAAGHYPHETAADRLIPAVLEFLATTPALQHSESRWRRLGTVGRPS